MIPTAPVSHVWFQQAKNSFASSVNKNVLHNVGMWVFNHNFIAAYQVNNI